MAISQWMDELRTGVEQFDNEHAQLFRLIDDLNGALKARLGDVVIDEVLNSLEKYTNTHFLHEEEFMAHMEYPKQEEHKIEHQKFANDIAKYRLDLFQSSVGLSVSIAYYLREWLNTHIKVKDKEYGAFAKEKGLIS
jgi:hemerythrin